MTTTPIDDEITVPGARLHYILQGSGPLLLLVAGGHGDTSRFAPLAAHLADCYTVLTYDRRGLSRSTTTDPARTLEGHAEDAARLLAAVTAEPAYVFGSSIGAAIALALATTHPDQVGAVVAHEPGAVALLPEPARAGAIADLQRVEEALVDDGVDAALRRFVEFADIDPTDREPDVARSDPDAQQLANLEFLIVHDLPALRAYEPDLEPLRSGPVHVVPAVGASSGHIWPNRCGRLLAERLGVGYETFPGGHNGSVFRPRGTAERLREVLIP